METENPEKSIHVPKSEGNTGSEDTKKWKGLLLVFGASMILLFFTLH